MARDALARKRILVVDDSLTVINMVRHLLEQEGYIVLAAADGLAAMNTAFREAPDLVIADVEMPEMSGLQLCRLLKGDPRTAAVPFLILSVHQAQHQQFWGRETGADDYLPKPFTPEALLDRVRALLARPCSRPDPPALPALPLVPAPGGTPDAAEGTTRLAALERLNASLERRLFDLTVVHGISAIAVTTTGERDSARAILERLARLVDFGAAMLTSAPAGESFVLVRKATPPQALRQLHDAAVEALPGPPAAPPPPVLLCGAELVSADQVGDDCCLALQPMHASGSLVGILGVAREARRPFLGPERDLLALVAGQAALVLGHARLTEAERAHAAQLQQQNEELQRLNRTITDLIASVTHDLRTPLSSVAGYIELAQEEASDQQRQFLEIARRNVDRMIRLVNELLDLSRLEAGHAGLRLQPTSLAETVAEAVLTLQPMLRERRQTCEVDLPAALPPLRADPTRLHEIVLNLLSNASQYNREGGHIRVEAAVEGDRVRVWVRDTGIGLSEEDQRQVFGRFFRARRPETANNTGTGLGLAIVKTLVELHGGEVFVESALNEGSTFGFVLPAVTPEDGPQADAEAAL